VRAFRVGALDAKGQTGSERPERKVRSAAQEAAPVEKPKRCDNFTFNPRELSTDRMESNVLEGGIWCTVVWGCNFFDA
jgi:hypothetical protein